MPAAQFSGGTISDGIATSRVSKSNQRTEKFKPIYSLRRGNADKLVALSGRKSLALGEFCLSERRRKLFSPLVIYRRENRSNVVANQWSSDSGVTSFGVEERLALQEDHGINGSGKGAS